ncbi:type VI secretion system TssO [Chitinophagaceae bacterium 26-R-25]|nr:type VI secretion system TssO [Chitinophagaceae bacterium 26-R-25]
MDDEKKVTLNRSERRQYLAYLAILFVVSCTMLTVIIFKNSDNPFKTISEQEVAYLKQEDDYARKLKSALPLYDSTFAAIQLLKNTPGNTIVESDIKGQINLLNSFYYEKEVHDPRCIAFKQMALFLKLYFEDMLVLKKKQENINLFQGQLDQCEIGYKNAETLLNQINAAQAARKEQ